MAVGRSRYSCLEWAGGCSRCDREISGLHLRGRFANIFTHSSCLAWSGRTHILWAGLSVSLFFTGRHLGCMSFPLLWGSPFAHLSSQGLYHTIPEGHAEGHGCHLANRDSGRGAVETAPAHSLPVTGAPWAQAPAGRQTTRGDRRGSQAGSLHTDSSCLLTPPSTPLGLEPGGPTWPETSGHRGKALLEGQRNGPGGPPGVVLEGEAWPA